MSTDTKKQIERNAKTLFPAGAVCRVVDRENPIEDEQVGEAVILKVTREEITAKIQGRRFGFDGIVAAFRVPTLTQRSGDLRLCLP